MYSDGRSQSRGTMSQVVSLGADKCNTDIRIRFLNGLVAGGWAGTTPLTMPLL
jgi:hypothetical protein